jgi:hypothetical protein
MTLATYPCTFPRRSKSNRNSYEAGKLLRTKEAGDHRMRNRITTAFRRVALSLLVFFSLAAILLPQVAQAQGSGTHITLRANRNPFPLHRRYGDVWGEGHYAYLCSDNASGVLIFDIANPSNPVQVANYAPANSFNMEDCHVQNGIGYFASNTGGGIHIVNLSDPTHPTQITRITSAQGGYDNAHNAFIDGNYLYISDYPVTPNVQVWDVSNPAAPVKLWTFLTTDPKFIHDETVKNGRLYTSGSGGKTDIWDVTNIATQPPVLLGSINSGFRSHSTWPTDDGNYLAATNEVFGIGAGTLTIYNISDPAHVTIASTITEAGFGLDAVTPTDPKIVGNLLYATWNQVGLVVFDITDPTNPVLVGNYDTWPGAVNANSFDGGWGIYPFLGQDRILMSDRDTGLYVLNATGLGGPAQLFNLWLTPSTVMGSQSSTGKVFLVGKAPSPGGVIADLSSNNNVVASVPANVVVPPGSSNATFTVTTTPVAAKTTVSITADDGITSKIAQLTVTLPTLTSLTVTPTPMVGGTTSTGKATFGVPVAANTPVTLALVSGASAVASIPASVTVPAGSTFATFPLVSNAVSAITTVKVTASANGSSRTLSFTVKPNGPSSLTFTPNSLVGTQSSTGKVTFGAAVSADTPVTLTVLSGAPAIASIPATVTVLAGTANATFTVTTNTVAGSTAAQISAAANGVSLSNTLTVKPNSPTLVSFTPAPVYGGGNTTGKVTFGLAVSVNTPVALSIVSGGSAIASMPSTVTVLAGATTATFTVRTNPVSVATSVVISATASSGSKSGTLTVKPNVPTSFFFQPATVTGGSSSTGKLAFPVPVATNTVVSILVVSGAAAVSSMPASVTVLAGGTTANFTLVTKPVGSSTGVQVSVSANGGSKTATLTVN